MHPSTWKRASGADGALRFNVYSDGAADPRLPSPPPVVRTVGNYVHVYDEWGSLVGTYTFNEYLDGVGLPGGDLASGSPEGTLYNPLGSYGGGGGGGGQPIGITSVDGERTRVERIREDLLQITTSGGSAAGVQAVGENRAGIESTRTFRRRNVPTSDRNFADAAPLAQPATVPHWVLESVDQIATVPRNGRTATVRTRIVYRYVSAHINRGRDKQRKEARIDTPAPSRAHRRSSSVTGMQAGRALVPGSDGIRLCATGENNLARTVGPSGGGVVYQHGFCSDATTWSAMRQRVPETHRVGVEQSYSLKSTDSIDAQVDDLARRLSATGVGGNVVVAHSQGGLVARRLGQRRPDLVSGVVTIGTPHEGALIASRPAYVVADALNDFVSEPCFGNVCALALEVAEGQAAGLLASGVGYIVPAAGDDQPGSALIRRVNGRSEYQYETFRRASIAMNIPVRWAIFRMLGDARSSRDRLLRGEQLKGRRYVRDAQDVYSAARVLRYLAMTLRWRVTDYGSGWGCHQSGYSYYWEPCYNPYGYYQTGGAPATGTTSPTRWTTSPGPSSG